MEPVVYYEYVGMSQEELREVLDPLIDDLSAKLDVVASDLEHLIKVQYGLLVAIGIVAGLILISYLLDRF